LSAGVWHQISNNEEKSYVVYVI